MIDKTMPGNIMPQKTILILGGTADARYLSEDLLAFIRTHRLAVRVIYSLAGLVRKTPLDCEVISGGFRQFGGLAKYLTDNQVDLMVNVTHPYAEKISEQARQAGAALAIPCWRFHRQAWQTQTGDDWHEFDNIETLIKALAAKSAVLLSSGQLSQTQIDLFKVFTKQKQLLRTAATPDNVVLPATMQWLQAIGPFSLEAETALLKAHGIDAIVSKNSGGASTYAKIMAANRLGIPVYMLKRPLLPAYQTEFYQIDDCFSALQIFIQTA